MTKSTGPLATRVFETVAPLEADRGVWWWYAACVYDGHEAEVVSRLADAGVEAYSPSEVVVDKRVPCGWRQRALFPGYVFARMPEAGPFRPLRMTKYVYAIITNGGHPQPVRGVVGGVNVIEAIRSAEALGVFDRTLKAEARRRFRPGQRVRLGDGPFAGFVAEIQGYTPAERVRVLLGMMGREAPVLVDENALEPA